MIHLCQDSDRQLLPLLSVKKQDKTHPLVIQRVGFTTIYDNFLLYMTIVTQ